MLYTEDTTIQELLKHVQGFQKAEQDKDDPSKYRYAIYVRKSTDRKDNQAKSLPDQISECKAYADKEGFRIADIIPEKESAKDSGIRPHFRQLIDDVKKGKYDGIIAWHPDRLARNMLEAGEIIDLLDKNIIKSLKFVSFSFQNDTSGKMLLGISFVMSKQYSDNLSDSINRAILGRLKEGQYLSYTKHGYYKDQNQLLRPDNDNFVLLKKAWSMRLDGMTLDEISDYLNKNGYTRATTFGKPNIPFKWNKQRLSVRFKDLVYAGILQYGEELKNLTEIYDFVPMVSPYEFMKLNKLHDLKSLIRSKNPVRDKNKQSAVLLNGKVICGHCNKITHPQIYKNKSDSKKFYYSFRCDNKECEMYGQGTRANFTIKLIESLKLGSKKHYEIYVKEMQEKQKQQTSLIESEQKSVIQRRIRLTEEIANTMDLLRSKKFDDVINQTFAKDLQDKQTELNDIEKMLDKIEIAKKEIINSVPDYLEFFELCKIFPSKLKEIKNMIMLDKLLSEICLNWTLKNKKVASYKLKPPFDSFENDVEDPKVLNGGARRT